jgi:hypothetical protein
LFLMEIKKAQAHTVRCPESKICWIQFGAFIVSFQIVKEIHFHIATRCREDPGVHYFVHWTSHIFKLFTSFVRWESPLLVSLSCPAPIRLTPSEVSSEGELQMG